MLVFWGFFVDFFLGGGVWVFFFNVCLGGFGGFFVYLFGGFWVFFGFLLFLGFFY